MSMDTQKLSFAPRITAHSELGKFSEPLSSIFRSLCAAIGALGVNLLFNEAIGFGASFFSLSFPIFAYSIAFFFLFRGKRSTVITALAMLVLSPHAYIYGGACTLWDRFMQHIDRAGYMSLPECGLEYTFSSAGAVMAFLSLLSCLILNLSLHKRTQSVPPFVYMATVCGLLIGYQMSFSAVGFSLLITAQAGYMAMRISEKNSRDKRSGYPAAAVMLLCFLILLFPTMSRSEPWEEIAPIKNAALQIGDYLAELFGSPLFYSDGHYGLGSPEERAVRAKRPSSTGEHLLTVKADKPTPMYLRSWVGGEYKDHAWQRTPAISSGENPTKDTHLTFITLFDGILRGDTEKHIGFEEVKVEISPKKRQPLLYLPNLMVDSLRHNGPSLYEFSVSEPYYDIKFTDLTGVNYNTIALIPSLYHDENPTFDALIEAYYEYYSLSFIPDWEREYTGDNKYTRMLMNRYVFTEKTNKQFLSHIAPTNALIDSLYSDIHDIEAIDMVIEKLFRESEISNYYNRINSDRPTNNENGVIYIEEDGKGVLYYLGSKEEALYADRIAKIVCRYLADNYDYTLTPPIAMSSDPIEEFLENSKQGYCVQFASAATLIMRRLGFSARYAEGYVVRDFRKTGSDSAYGYEARITDNDAHAWMEVWISGFGWMQYEATPGIIGSGQTPPPETDTTEPPDTQTTDTTKEPDTSIKDTDTAPDTDPPSIIETEDTDPATSDIETSSDKDKSDGGKGAILVIIAAGLIILLSVTVILVSKRSARLADERKKLLNKALYCDGLEDEKIAELGARLVPILSSLLELCGLSLTAGELPSEFAVRCDRAFPDAMLPLSLAIKATEKQIYGGGMSKDDLKSCARVIHELSKRARKQAGLPKFLWHRYIICDL